MGHDRAISTRRGECGLDLPLNAGCSNDNPVGALDGGRKEGQEAPADLPGQRLRHVQGGEIVQRDDRRDRHASRQGEERRPEDVDVAALKPGWKPELLPEDAERRALNLDGDSEPFELVGDGGPAVGHGDDLEAATAGQLPEQRERVDPDAGRRPDGGAEVDGETGLGDLRLLEEWPAGGRLGACKSMAAGASAAGGGGRPQPIPIDSWLMTDTEDRSRREEVAATLAAIGAAVRQRRAEVATAGLEGDELAAQVAEVRRYEFVQEPRPVSPRPGLGRLIVLARKLFYHLFGKWHARAVLQQQNEFNQSAATLLAGIVERERDQRRELARLRARLEELTERLDRLAGDGESRA